MPEVVRKQELAKPRAPIPRHEAVGTHLSDARCTFAERNDLAITHGDPLRFDIALRREAKLPHHYCPALEAQVGNPQQLRYPYSSLK